MVGHRRCDVLDVDVWADAGATRPRFLGMDDKERHCPFSINGRSLSSQY